MLSLRQVTTLLRAVDPVFPADIINLIYPPVLLSHTSYELLKIVFMAYIPENNTDKEVLGNWHNQIMNLLADRIGTNFKEYMRDREILQNVYNDYAYMIKDEIANMLNIRSLNRIVYESDIVIGACIEEYANTLLRNSDLVKFYTKSNMTSYKQFLAFNKPHRQTGLYNERTKMDSMEATINALWNSMYDDSDRLSEGAKRLDEVIAFIFSRP